MTFIFAAKCMDFIAKHRKKVWRKYVHVHVRYYVNYVILKVCSRDVKVSILRLSTSLINVPVLTFLKFRL